jgi:hypothetical protein
MAALTLPLAVSADRLLLQLSAVAGSAAIAALDGATLLGERAMLFNFRIPDRISSGGGCRLYAARGDVLALNLARHADRELLPAWLETEFADLHDDAAIGAAIARRDAGVLLVRGRQLGLAIAAVQEATPARGTACELLDRGSAERAPRRTVPRVIDLSALWAGPLAAHLLWLAGAEVIKVESRTRPDRMRDSDPVFYDLLNQGKSGVALDFRAPADCALLQDLLADADIVIEAARPRALLQLGVDAGALVRSNPGLVWITITGHGATGDAGNWIGFGDDCGVAGGLSAALHAATGEFGIVGDAIADPLTGIRAARVALEQWRQQHGARLGINMTAVVADCLAEARAADPAALTAQLRAWRAAVGRPYPEVSRRPLAAPTPRWHRPVPNAARLSH